MTKIETAQLLSIIKVAYPYAYKDFSNAMALDYISMWQNTFADVPFSVMLLAWDKYRMENKFAPTFADFIECLRDLHDCAWFDLACARVREDLETMKRCRYVMDATERFRASNAQINYGLISNAELELRADESKYLNEKIEYIE